jgi:hypothetical protein
MNGASARWSDPMTERDLKLIEDGSRSYTLTRLENWGGRLQDLINQYGPDPVERVAISTDPEPSERSGVHRLLDIVGVGELSQMNSISQDFVVRHGSAGNDYIIGLQDNEKIFGYGGNDWIEGRYGFDTIDGGDGNDILFGGFDKDLLYGGPGDDWLSGEDHDDLLDGGAGNDNIQGGRENDVLAGRSGNDTLLGDNGDDRLVGGDGHDLLWGLDQDDRLEGGIGNDTLIGGRGYDALVGGDGDDHYVFSKDDVIPGNGIVPIPIDGSVTSTSTPDGGRITEVSGGGIDTISADYSFALAGIAHVENLTLTGVNNINATGNYADNRLTGNDADNRLRGSLGYDTLDGRGGADTFVFGAVAESTSLGRDRTLNMNLNTEDRFDFTLVPTSIGTTVTTGALNVSSFDADLAVAVNAGLAVNGVILFDPSSGNMNLAGQVYLVLDANADGAYTAGADYVIQMHYHTGTLTLDDFI